MAYCVLADLEKVIPEDALIQLTDDENAGTVDATRISEAIAQADAEIDAYLGSRYDVPLAAPIPDIVKKISVDLAIYHLYSRRMEDMPKVRQERYNGGIRLLEGIAKGTVSIGEATEPPGETDQIKVTRTVADKIFSRGKKSDGSSGSLDNY